MFGFVCFCFCFVFCLFFRHRDGPIGPCRGPPIVRPLLIHLLTKMAELPTALINGQHTACKSVLIDLAKAKRRWTGKKGGLSVRSVYRACFFPLCVLWHQRPCTLCGVLPSPPCCARGPVACRLHAESASPPVLGPTSPP